MRLVTAGMAQGQAVSRYGAGRRSPLGLGGTIAVHALIVGAFLLIPKEVIETVFTPKPLDTRNIPIPPPPDPIVEKQADPKVQTQPRQQPTVTDPVVILPKGDPPVTATKESGTAVGPGPSIIVPPIDPPRAPVLTDAAIDPRAMGTFQPDYPGAMIRQGMEGAVTVRVTISPDGRVTDIEKLSATDESFWAATQRHALRKWRFRPATRDGIAVTSSKVLTVRFTLADR
ncbi:TonB family protein [Sphingobium sp. BYY-5]|uniref:energy transducer TonB n=1 Tax=Sphingobium sp. BYY-5 TaxID=2926400 RepID=UPI001FA7D909|nr:energy transducer TonB [Sphingobium sp. BYY-5]MCI4590613.1 TonB family protein [Sphingobium sp. BYY-5]